MTIRGREAAAQMGGRVWRNRMQDLTWRRLDEGERYLHGLFDLTKKGFEITTSFEYDQVNVQYLARFELYALATNPSYHSKLLFTHEEPGLIFPSEVLIAKVMMVVG